MRIKSSVALLLILIVVLMPIFAHLDGPPLQLWDESRLASNALEMVQNNNWIVTKYDGQPDMWMTKPPLMIWVQALLIKLIGPSELAVRLPSALAALATCLLMFFLFARKYKEPLLSMLCCFVLITLPGYVMVHGTRTGEYDSLLTALMAGYAIYYFLYLEEGKKIYLYATFVLLMLACLTKGIESLVFLPGLFIYTIYKKKLVTIIKTKDFYLGTGIFLFFAAGYYLLREHYNPGYLHAVRENELGSRFNTAIEGHSGDAWYYYDLLISDQMHNWYLLIVPGIIMGLISKIKWIRDVTVYATILVITYLVIISTAQTKVYWYAMPMMPFLAIIAGVFLFSIFQLLEGISPDSYRGQPFFSYNPRWLFFFFTFLIFVTPYCSIINSCLSNNVDLYIPDDRKNMKIFLKDALHHDRNIDGCSVLNDDLSQDISWYCKVFTFKHYPIGVINENEIMPGNKIIVYNNDAKKRIEDHYRMDTLQSFRNVMVYKINAKK